MHIPSRSVGVGLLSLWLSDAVLAVAIEQHTLAPGGSSAVYVIRRTQVQP